MPCRFALDNHDQELLKDTDLIEDLELHDGSNGQVGNAPPLTPP